MNTSDIQGAQPKKVNTIQKGLKRRNFFEDGQIEQLHLKDKYGRKNVSSNVITHEKDNNNFGSYASVEALKAANQGPQGYRKNIGNTYAPPLMNYASNNSPSRDHSPNVGEKVNTLGET